MTDTMTDPSSPIADAGESALIERIRQRAGDPPAWVTLGIGDDAAVVMPARSMADVITTDTLVEDVHFRRAWTPLDAVGHKALAVSVSDLAAMGAEPRAAFVSLVLPGDLTLGDFDALVGGLFALADRVPVPIAGGNLTRSPGPIVIETTLVGAAHPRKILTRSGAKAGDELYLTGSIGGAAAGLALRARGAAPGDDPDARAALTCYERPEARLRCGLSVARARAASACIDLSDGLADGAAQIARASGVAAVLNAGDIPVHPAAALAAGAGRDALTVALTGGEDYELLFAVPPRRRSRFLSAVRRGRLDPPRRVGRLEAGQGAWLARDGHREPLPPGFVHF